MICFGRRPRVGAHAGVAASSNASSAVYFLALDGPVFLDSADLAARHRLRAVAAFRRSPRIGLSCRRPKKPVDLAEIANCFHVAAVHPIHETILRANDSHKPLPTFGKSNRNETLRRPASDRMLT